MMLLEHLCSPLGFVITHAFMIESHIVKPSLKALQTPVSCPVDMKVF